MSTPTTNDIVITSIYSSFSLWKLKKLRIKILKKIAKKSTSLKKRTTAVNRVQLLNVLIKEKQNAGTD